MARARWHLHYCRTRRLNRCPTTYHPSLDSENVRLMGLVCGIRRNRKHPKSSACSTFKSRACSPIQSTKEASVTCQAVPPSRSSAVPPSNKSAKQPINTSISKRDRIDSSGTHQNKRICAAYVKASQAVFGILG